MQNFSYIVIASDRRERSNPDFCNFKQSGLLRFARNDDLKKAAVCLFVCLVIVGGGTGQAQAARFTGNYLLEMCASDATGKELVAGGHTACQSYISGIIDYYNLLRSFGPVNNIDFCIPDGTPLNRIQNQVGAYIYKNKNVHGSFNAAPGVALALHSVYPCKRKR